MLAHIGALIITYALLVVPYYNYNSGIMKLSIGPSDRRKDRTAQSLEGLLVLSKNCAGPTEEHRYGM